MMKPAIAFSVVAAFALVAMPTSAGAECMGHKQQLVRSSVPTTAAAEPATETTSPQVARIESTTQTVTPTTRVADLTVSDRVTEVEEE